MFVFTLVRAAIPAKIGLERHKCGTRSPCIVRHDDLRWNTKESIENASYLAL